MESWGSLGGKEGRTNVQISAEPGIKLGTLWSEGRDLTNCDNHAHSDIPKECFKSKYVLNEYLNMF